MEEQLILQGIVCGVGLTLSVRSSHERFHTAKGG